MEIAVLLFATLKDITGQNRLTVTLDAPAATVNDVRAALIAQFPHGSENFKAAVASLNEEFAFGAEPVTAGDHVAFFPPVSGGSGQTQSVPEHFAVTPDPVDHDAIVASITTPAVGAVCFFSGMVRGSTQRDGHLPQVEELHYEAYESMAVAKMKQVAVEIRARYPEVVGIAMVQRVGRLKVGENTVLIACSSGHRDSGCFEAARYGIDRLKEIVPVWKQEIAADRQTWIEGAYVPGEGDRAGQS
jgi:molybdopterin synthase catalytic subunit